MTRFAAQFGGALIGYVMLGLLILLTIEFKANPEPPPRVWAAAGFFFGWALLFAVFARVRWGWRGFLYGALLATGIVVVLSLSVVLLLRAIGPRT